MSRPEGGEPTIGELLAPTGLPELLDRTPAQVLDDLGVDLDALLGELPALELPQLDLPELDLPELDLAGLPVPSLDPLGLLTPLTDLLGSFGTGSFAGGTDPAAILLGLAQTLQTGMTTASSALRALDGMWTGSAGTAAATKGAQAVADAGALAGQSTALGTDVQAALAVVAAGLAQLQGVAVATAGKIAATVPVLGTPPGQLAALGFAAEGLTEGLAVVAATRAQLTAPTAKVAADGLPVAVTGAPAGSGQSPFALAAGVLDALAPLVGSGAEVAGVLLGADATAPDASVPTGESPADTAAVPAAALAGSGAAATGTSGSPATGSQPTLRAASLGAAPSLGSTVAVDTAPTLGARPATAEPVAAGTTTAAAPSGWSRGAAESATGTGFTPVAAAGGLAGARPAVGAEHRTLPIAQALAPDDGPEPQTEATAALQVDVALRLDAGWSLDDWLADSAAPAQDG